MRQWFDGRRVEMEDWLHTIHRQPETGFTENHTAAFVAKTLEAAGIEVHSGIGQTGVVGVLHGTAGEGRSIGFRSELDALPMQECSGVHYHSQADGKFHGCGHDGHTVTLLAAASYLAEHRDFKGTAYFVFQPAEELLTGAQAMLDDGFLERFPCDEIYALHNYPGLGKGKVGVCSAGALASADHIVIKMQAKGTHASMPHTGEDAVMASAYLLTTLQQSLGRILDTRDSGVVSFGSIHAGTACNILPEKLKMEGTIRTHSEAVREAIKQLLEKVVRSTESLYGVSIDLSYPVESPVTLNHPEQVRAVLDAAVQVAGVENVHANHPPLMTSEDFAYFLKKVPGAYFFMGQDGPFCHHPEFIFDTDIIPLGASVISELIRQRAAI